MVERRKRVRNPAVTFPKELREHLVAASKQGAAEALAETMRLRDAYMDGITPQEHVEHHKSITQRNLRWSNFVDEGWKEGGKLLARVAVIGAGAALAGSKLYEWISKLLAP